MVSDEPGTQKTVCMGKLPVSTGTFLTGSDCSNYNKRKESICILQGTDLFIQLDQGLFSGNFYIPVILVA